MEIRVFFVNADGFVCAKSAQACSIQGRRSSLAHFEEQTGARMKALTAWLFLRAFGVAFPLLPVPGSHF